MALASAGPVELKMPLQEMNNAVLFTTLARIKDEKISYINATKYCIFAIIIKNQIK